MRTRYIVCYDIAEPARLRKVHLYLRGYGEWMQFSIFSCELNERERVTLGAGLEGLINAAEDQVLFIDVGPVEGRAGTAVESLGRKLEPRKRVQIL